MAERRRNFLEPAIAKKKHLCPLKGKYLQEGVVSKAIVTQTESMKPDTYIEMTENHFKTRYKIQDRMEFYGQSKTMLPASKKCDLCLESQENILYYYEICTHGGSTKQICRHKMKCHEMGK